MASSEKYVEQTSSPIDSTDHETSSSQEVFGNNEKHHQIQFRTLSWPFVAFIMTTEIVTIGTLGIPQALAVVGLVPGIIVTAFCGFFALYTAFLLIDFKLNHPAVHSMGDAGYILFAPFGLGWLGREVLSAGTIVFAIFSVGAMALAGGLALVTLSDGRVCTMLGTGIYAVAILVFSLPRTFDFGLQWLSVVACASVLIAAVVGMVGAGLEPTPGRQIEVALPQSFYVAFLTITNPVIAYAGHFMFFPIISEMKKPRDAKKAAWFLQIFATCLYILYGVVTYIYLGDTVMNPSFLSLSPTWSKAAWGLLLPNLLVCGALYNHVAAKIIFVRIFRRSHQLYSHTALSWLVWVFLLLISCGAAFVLAIGVAIFTYLAGLAAAAFASWYTYGLAGAFWWHDTHFLGNSQAYKYPQGIAVRGWPAVRRRPIMFTLAVLTILAGGFICVAGLFAIIKSIVLAYENGLVGQPFSC